MEANKEIRLKGVSLSAGIAWGKIFFLSKSRSMNRKSVLQKKEVDREILRYRFALSRSRQDLTSLCRPCEEKSSSPVQKILQTHLELLFDPAIVEMVEERIRVCQQRTEAAFENVIEEYQNRFHQMEDLFFQQRVQDVVDVAQRIMKNLKTLPEKNNDLKKVVICAEEIFPSDAMGAGGEDVLAFVTARGGYDSHAAIIARSRSIPYVSEIDFARVQNLKIEEILVDATNGEVVCNPSKKTLKLMEEKIKILEKEKLRKEVFRKMPENQKVECYVNIETIRDLDKVANDQIAGVGIFRTEFLFLAEKGVPGLARQVQIYTELAKKLAPKPFIIRLFDVGADKSDLFSQIEKTPFGKRSLEADRGIRFLLKHPKILEDQLLAILEASQAGVVHLLLPFVSDVAEILEVKARIRELKKRILIQNTKLHIGSMIEVPAAALMADRIVKEVDFLSIGTNDLVQYLFGFDRRQAMGLSKNIPLSLLRLLQMVIKQAELAKKPVILCGELAASADYLPIFLGLGIERFSLSTFHLSAFKERVMSLKSEYIQKRTKEALDSL